MKNRLMVLALAALTISGEMDGMRRRPASPSSSSAAQTTAVVAQETLSSDAQALFNNIKPAASESMSVSDIIEQNPKALNEVSRKGDTPLLYSVRKNRTDVFNDILNSVSPRQAKTLIQQVNTLTGKTLAHYAVAKANREVLERLNSIPEFDFTATDVDGNTILHTAALDGNMEADFARFVLGLRGVADIVDQLNNPQDEDLEAQTAFALATSNGNAALANLLQGTNRDTDTDLLKVHDGDGNTMLHLVARSGSFKQLKGAAAGREDFEALPALLARIAKLSNREAILNATNAHNRTALQLAARDGRFKCVQALLAAGADATWADDQPFTALEMALNNYPAMGGSSRPNAQKRGQATGQDLQKLQNKYAKVIKALWAVAPMTDDQLNPKRKQVLLTVIPEAFDAPASAASSSSSSKNAATSAASASRPAQRSARFGK